MITSEAFGKTADGREVRAYVLRDGANSATVLNYGGIVQKLLVQGRENKTYNVVLGYGSPSEYDANGGYLGAFIGRVGNRIGKGKFTLDGRDYQLNCNDGNNHLHGGHKGFNTKIFDAETEGGVLVLSGTSADGEENYPGNLRMEVRYSFVGGELKIEYTAVSDRKTLINLTNHTYFNLDGEGSGDILGHTLYIDADRVTTADRELIPHGEFRDVEGTPFDFRKPKKVGKDIGCTGDCDIANGGGYDINYVLNRRGEYRKVAEIAGAESGVAMEVYTDLPGLQFYSGNMLDTKKYKMRTGFCLETQFLPNAVNCPSYAALGSPVYDKDQIYHSVTAYKFTVR